VTGGGPAPAVEPGPGYPRQPTIRSSAVVDYGWLPLKYAANAAKMVTFDPICPRWSGLNRRRGLFPSSWR